MRSLARAAFGAGVAASLLLLCSAARGVAQASVLSRVRARAGVGMRGRSLLASLEPAGKMLKPLDHYYDNAEIEAWLKDFTSRCGHMSRKYSIGKSLHGQEIWVLEISDRPGEEEPEPNFKYTGNMHGDEPLSRALMPALAEWLCANAESDPVAAIIVNDMHLHLAPSVNPDGFAGLHSMSRENAAGADLNRDFPDPIQGDVHHPTGREQPETQALMDWIQRGPKFAGGAAMHEGAVVANYPWDGSEAGFGGYAACPDDAAFRHLAQTYADAHEWMHTNNAESFVNGITNGAAWYPVYGGMQDYSYLVGECFDLTLELSNAKHPPESTLHKVWKENADALLALPLEAGFGGLRGAVVEAGDEGATGPWRFLRRLMRDAHSGAGTPLRATIEVEGIDFAVTSGETFGQFYRPLAPGTYSVTASAPGYASETKQVVVRPGEGGVLYFHLAKSDGKARRAGAARALLGQNASQGAAGPAENASVAADVAGAEGAAALAGGGNGSAGQVAAGLTARPRSGFHERVEGGATVEKWMVMAASAMGLAQVAALAWLMLRGGKRRRLAKRPGAPHVTMLPV
ncbi:unnamed protein product [Pedinophyceae sp. YPF-701]|nr:unnamed protein product [Pedinophyceae sp. YPF-701]